MFSGLVFVHHSAVSREERLLAEEQFHRGADACIVCTSTLELGIDVGDLDRVLQAEAPETVSSFLQRMGRTGRRDGQVANTTFYCETEDGVLQAIALIELAKQGWVEDVELDTRCWPVLVHQLLALALAHDGITIEDAWQHLARVPDFGAIHRAEFDRLVAWMLRDQSLRLASGRLVLGPTAERRYGRRNFMELYAVFSSPQSYTVETTDGRTLGTLNQGFVDRLVDGVSCFLLAGRAWTVRHIGHDERRVVVEPAPRGQRPTWGGYLPQFLGHRLCRQIRAVLGAKDVPPYLTPEAVEILEQRRQAMAGILQPGDSGVTAHDIEFDTSGEIRWWTFAGGRINATLRYALEVLGRSWKVVADNFHLTIRGEELTRAAFHAALAELAEIEFWEDETVWKAVGASLPSYRLSKFQPLMPPWVVREVVAGYLLDLAGAWQVAARTEATGRIERLPPALRVPNAVDLATLESPVVPPPPPARDPSRPLVWVDSPQALSATVAELRSAAVVGLDVETSLRSRALCLIQLATSERTYVIDPLEVPDLAPLQGLLADPGITKLIHNAAFERAVLARYDLALDGVVDTLQVSRERRGRKLAGGHGLKAVCQRELGLELDKSWQTSDWSRRPLAEGQLAYAAIDAEVLLRLHEHFGSSSG